MKSVNCDFQIRQDECDATRRLSTSNYFRYLQEAAIQGSAQLGYSQEYYESIQRGWIARETNVEFYRHLLYGETISIKTYVAKTQKTHSLRYYEIKETASNIIVSKATTDWVFLDKETKRPVSIPQEMITVFDPEETALSMQLLPLETNAPDRVFFVPRMVQWQDIDMAHHVSNAVYLSYIDDATVYMCATHEWGFERMISEKCVLIPEQHRIIYRSPAKIHDDLVIKVWFSSESTGTLIRHCIIERHVDKMVIALISSLYKWDIVGQTPARLPEFLNDMRDYIVMR